jgi:hypothetical protein
VVGGGGGHTLRIADASLCVTGVREVARAMAPAPAAGPPVRVQFQLPPDARGGQVLTIAVPVSVSASGTLQVGRGGAQEGVWGGDGTVLLVGGDL